MWSKLNQTVSTEGSSQTVSTQASPKTNYSVNNPRLPMVGMQECSDFSSVLILRAQDIISDSMPINTACFVGSNCCFYSVLVLVGFALVVQNRQKTMQCSVRCLI